jgi:hypothetical protein
MPVVINGDTGITQSGEFDSDSTFGFKNRIINPGMVIDQRNAGASVTGTNTLVFPVDRWASFEDSDGVMTFQRSTNAPPGFSYSVIATTTTADSSLSASQRAVFVQRVEGFNIADFGWGTANAQTVTLSFWVRSSLTGTFGGALTNLSRSYGFSYTISAANTWEYKTVTISGDTSGTWDTTNGLGVQITFGLGVGSNFVATAGAWSAGDLNSVSGAVSVIGTLNATWQVTGVQFEKGSTATSFDFRSYGTELALCQRYYEKSYNIDVAVPTATTNGMIHQSGSSDSGNNLSLPIKFCVSKRAAPTMTAYRQSPTTVAVWDYFRNGASGTATVNFADIGQNACRIYIDIGAAWVVGGVYGQWIASSEL